MKSLLVLAPALVSLATVSGEPLRHVVTPPADLAVAPFTVEHDSGAVLRALADTCLERLVEGLTTKGIAVARHRQLSEKDLRSARPARWAVLGHLSREQGQFRAELRLMEVESAEEIRSYFNADKDPMGIADLGAAAAARIATYVHEQRAQSPGQ
jgi:hypothetical protein